jgi:diguanylate cyclase (GGDEF)-like protein
MMFKNLKRGLIYTGVLSLVSLISIYLVFNIENKNLKNKISEVVKSDLVAYAETVQHKLAMTAGDIFLIKDLLLSKSFLVLTGTGTGLKSKASRRQIENNFKKWLKNKNKYDQIRILDSTGREVVRVNYNEAKPFAVEEKDLQDKGDRYYFLNSINLDDDSLYLSKFDLNIENGEIEIVEGHPKPMIRIATPLFDDNGQRLGILILNYLAADLFEFWHRSEHSAYTRFEVINEKGFYVNAINPEIEFGFMYEDKQDEVFSKYHDYEIFSNTSQYVAQEQCDDEIYSSLAVSEKSLSNRITKSIMQPISVVSESGNLIVFGEVEYFETDEFKKLAGTYIIWGIISFIVSLIISKLLDELYHSRKKQLMILEFNSTHDILTQLPNRLHIFKAIEYKLSRRHNLVVLFLDLDGFKQIKDEFGHDVGDMGLIESAKRLKKNVRKDDEVARIGGDEFLVLLNDLHDKKIISRLCKVIIDDFSREFVLDGNRCKMGISIGVGLSSENVSTEVLIKNADAAMYKVKHENKNNFCFFDNMNN